MPRVILSDVCTIVREVGSDNEQVGLVGLGVGTGELDLLAEVVALVAGCHDSDCALLDIYVNFVVLEVRVVTAVGKFCSTRMVYFWALVQLVVVNSMVRVPEVEVVDQGVFPGTVPAVYALTDDIVTDGCSCTVLVLVYTNRVGYRCAGDVRCR